MTATIQTTATNSGSGTAATGNKPSGVVSGDLMIASVAIDLGASPIETISAPGGWTTIQDAAYDYQYGTRLALYYRVAGGSEPASWDWTLSGSNQWTTVLVRIDGQHASTPIDVSGKTEPSGSTDVPEAPSVVTTVADCLVLYVVGMDRDNTPFTEPGGTTERWDYGDGGDVSQSGASKTQASAGATGAGQFTASASDQWAAVTVAIAPTAGAGGLSIPVAMHHLRQQGIS